ncbi:hypothetical protein [Lysinibacillus sp. NPDC093688]|uniref:hypothetical protein n=1 Tax=Lysinibacillus sp. NPDC093688 TaxID=3390577 RepID=UPI003CFFA941
MENTVQNVNQAKGEVINTSSSKRKRMKGNIIVEEGNILKVYPNVVVDKTPFIFDIEDKDLVKKYTIYRHKEGYAVAYDKERGKKVWLHRAVMDMLDKPSKDYVDHINGDKNDNRKCNLRICHEDDASNAKNKNRKFFGHERVVKYRQPDDTFVLNISNGIIQDVEFVYAEFKHLLEDEDILWNQGVDMGLKTIIKRNEMLALEQISASLKGTNEYIVAQTEYDNLQELKAFLVTVYKNAQAFSLENKLPKGLSFIENKVYIVEDEYKTSKEMHELKWQPSIIFYGNKHNQEPAGKHLKKPNGEMIYN